MVLEGEMENFKGNAIVGQSGGPTAAINATLSGVIRGALESGHVGKIYGMRHGIEGFLKGNTVCLNELFANETEEKLRLLEHTPAAALGSCRVKLPDPFSEKEEDLAVYEDIFRRLSDMGIAYFFYIGGNDSMDTILKLSRYASRMDRHEVCFVGIPKTIDNDLAATDHSPGFGSAAKYVATVTQEILRDCAVYTVKAVTVIEIMGRDAGWLTTASTLGHAWGQPEPDFICLPERPFSMEEFLENVEKAFLKHPNVVVAVSEGIHYADGDYVGESKLRGEADIFGHRRLGGVGQTLAMVVREKFNCKTRSVELNLPQRCAGHILSATDIAEAISIGKAAVMTALQGESGIMMVFERVSDAPYRCRISWRSIEDIANSVRRVPKEYISEDGSHVTDALLSYLLPLVEGECYPEYRNGIPVYFGLEE